MSRITKDIASYVAKQLLASKTDQLKAIKKEEQAYIRSVYLKQIPESVMDCYNSNPGYFRCTGSLYINGPGLPIGHKTYSIGDTLPCVTGDRITITERESNKIIKFEDTVADMQKEINELRDNIEVSLYNLRTYNNVEKEFPEAFEHLPAAPANTALAINVKDLRCKLGVAAC
jgi:hypothetical protein